MYAVITVITREAKYQFLRQLAQCQCLLCADYRQMFMFRLTLTLNIGTAILYRSVQKKKKTFRVIQYTGNALLLAYRQKFDKWLRKLPKIDFVHEIVAETLQYPSSNAPVTSSDEWMQAKTNYFSSTYSPIISLQIIIVPSLSTSSEINNNVILPYVAHVNVRKLFFKWNMIYAPLFP